MWGKARLSWYRLGAQFGWLESLGESFNKFLFGVDFRMDLSPYELGNIEWGCGIRRIGYPSGALSQRVDMHADLLWTLEGGALFFAEAYAEIFRDRGGFAEFGFAYPVEAGPATITPGIRVGLDAGIVSGSRRLRENHVQGDLFFTYPVSADPFHLAARISHSLPLSNLDNLPAGRSHTAVTLALVFGKVPHRLSFR